MIQCNCCERPFDHNPMQDMHILCDVCKLLTYKKYDALKDMCILIDTAQAAMQAGTDVDAWAELCTMCEALDVKYPHRDRIYGLNEEVK